jgi:hypothetical protein
MLRDGQHRIGRSDWEKDEWEPSPQDIQWMIDNINSLLGPKGLWEIPRSRSVFLFDKTIKTVTIIDAGNSKDVLFVRSLKVLQKLGWTIKETQKE